MLNSAKVRMQATAVAACGVVRENTVRNQGLIASHSAAILCMAVLESKRIKFAACHLCGENAVRTLAIEHNSRKARDGVKFTFDADGDMDDYLLFYRVSARKQSDGVPGCHYEVDKGLNRARSLRPDGVRLCRGSRNEHTDQCSGDDSLDLQH